MALSGCFSLIFASDFRDTSTKPKGENQPIEISVFDNTQGRGLMKI